MIPHDHPNHERLHPQCPGCIDIIRRSDWLRSLPRMTNDQLVEALMARDHIHDDWQANALRAELAQREQAAS